MWGQGVDSLIPALDLRSDFPLSTQLCMALCKAHQAPLFVEFSRHLLRMGCHFLLQGIFLTQGLNPCLLHSPGDLHVSTAVPTWRNCSSFLSKIVARSPSGDFLSI